MGLDSDSSSLRELGSQEQKGLHLEKVIRAFLHLLMMQLCG